MWTIEAGRPIWRTGIISFSLDSFCDAPWADLSDAEEALIELIDLKDKAWWLPGPSPGSDQDHDAEADEHDGQNGVDGDQAQEGEHTEQDQ